MTRRRALATFTAVSIGLAAGTVLAIGMTGSALASALLPHRAAYRLSLADAPETQIGELQGRLVIEWKATCDLWLSYQRMAFVAVQRDGRAFGHDVRYSSAEGTDGGSLQFAVRTYDGNELVEAYRGRADLQPGEGGAATFTVPEPRRIELPPGSTFPAAHLEEIVRLAERGERMATHQVFDGWGYDSLVQVTTVIGAREAGAPAIDAAGDPADAAWQVSMAYYGPGEEPEMPNFEATFLLSSSGVLHDLELNYGDFVVDGELAEIELFEQPAC